jgi:hypothetical protein
MINPQTKVQTDLYIHAARAAVWQKYTRLHDWPAWQPTVQAAQWRQGERWQEGAQFTVRDQNGQTTNYVIRMVAPESVTVWETLNAPLNAVYSLHCSEQVGGCKVTLSCTYHGVAALANLLLSGRRRSQLVRQLHALKQHFERR